MGAKSAITPSKTKAQLRLGRDKKSIDELVEALHPIHKILGQEAFSPIAQLIREIHRSSFDSEYGYEKVCQIRKRLRANIPEKINQTLESADTQTVKNIYHLINLQKIESTYQLKEMPEWLNKIHSLANHLHEDFGLKTSHSAFALYSQFAQKTQRYELSMLIDVSPKLLEQGGITLLRKVIDITNISPKYSRTKTAIRDVEYGSLRQKLLEISPKAIDQVGMRGFKTIIKKSTEVFEREYTPVQKEKNKTFFSRDYEKIHEFGYDVYRDFVSNSITLFSAGGKPLLDYVAEKGLDFVVEYGPTITSSWIYASPKIVKKKKMKGLQTTTQEIEKLIPQIGKRASANLFSVIQELEELKTDKGTVLDAIIPRVIKGVENSHRRSIEKLLKKTPHYLKEISQKQGIQFALEMYDEAISITPSYYDSEAPITFLKSCTLVEKIGKQRFRRLVGLVKKQYTEATEDLERIFRIVSNSQEILLEKGEKKSVDELISFVNTLHGKASFELMRDQITEEGREKDTFEEIAYRVMEFSSLYQLCATNRIDSRFFTKQIKNWKADDISQKLPQLKDKITIYAGFVEKQRKIYDSFKFREIEAQNLLRLYEEYLERTFSQFERDFEATGTDLLSLPQIKERYEKIIEENRLRPVINYIAKKRSRDLLRNLHESYGYETHLQEAMKRLHPEVGARGIVHLLDRFHRAYNLLYEVSPNYRSRSSRENLGATQLLIDRLQEIPEGSSVETVVKQIDSSKNSYREKVTGNVPIPPQLESQVDNLIHAYWKDSGSHMGIDVQPILASLVSTYLQAGAKKTQEMLLHLEGNTILRKQLLENGIAIDNYRKGLEKTYLIGPDGDELQRIHERIQSELNQAVHALCELEIDEKVVSELKGKHQMEQVKIIEQLLLSHTKDNERIRQEVSNHIFNIRNVPTQSHSKVSEVTFYVSQDPFESLHMGTYFNTCLGLNNSNAWASVVNTVDVNKNVIYGRTKENLYVTRNRTALTDGGILFTRFHENTNIPLEVPWTDYLCAYADFTQQPILISTKMITQSMEKALEKRNGVQKKEMGISIAPAYFNKFYGDGLPTRNQKDGRTEIEDTFYIISPQKIST